MSAVVYILDSARQYMSRKVPDANHAKVNGDGHLVLETSSSWGATQAGLFKQWDHVVIDQRWIRDNNGRFVSKEKK